VKVRLQNLSHGEQLTCHSTSTWLSLSTSWWLQP